MKRDKPAKALWRLDRPAAIVALGGALTGLLGNLLAGPGTRAGDFVFGPITSAGVGLLARLGSRSLRRFRTVCELGAMAVWTAVAGLGASVFTAALAWMLAGLGGGRSRSTSAWRCRAR